MDSIHRTGSCHLNDIQWSRLLKRISLFFLAALFVTAGIAHFRETELFVKIVPPHLPAPRLLVYISGIAEIAGGVSLLLPHFRRPAAWGLMLLLVAVFPANIYMAAKDIQVTAQPIPRWILWARLPLQAVLIAWVLWATNQSIKINPPASRIRSLN